jgi:hypothetical protein
MTADAKLHRLRTFLFALSASLFAGTVLELIAVKHYQDPMQFVPFALCGLGIVMIVLTWFKANILPILVVRALMVVIAAGSALGVYQHITGNYEFASEIHPRWSTLQLLEAAVRGRDPLMAPGILAVGAVLALAATFASDTSTEPVTARLRFAPQRF